MRRVRIGLQRRLAGRCGPRGRRRLCGVPDGRGGQGEAHLSSCRERPAPGRTPGRAGERAGERRAGRHAAAVPTEAPVAARAIVPPGASFAAPAICLPAAPLAVPTTAPPRAPFAVSGPGPSSHCAAAAAGPRQGRRAAASGPDRPGGERGSRHREHPDLHPGRSRPPRGHHHGGPALDHRVQLVAAGMIGLVTALLPTATAHAPHRRGPAGPGPKGRRCGTGVGGGTAHRTAPKG